MTGLLSSVKAWKPGVLVQLSLTRGQFSDRLAVISMAPVFYEKAPYRNVNKDKSLILLINFADSAAAGAPARLPAWLTGAAKTYLTDFSASHFRQK
jgi:hypothetical protein